MAKSSTTRTLTAYGEPGDEIRLAVIASLDGISKSETILRLLRKEFEARFGDVDPKVLAPE